KQLADARKRLSAPDSEYRRAEAAFRAADDPLAAKMKEVQKLRQAGKKVEADILEKELEPLQQKRKEARERFDLAIQERKTLHERIASLPAKIDREKKALEKLEGPHTHGHTQEEPAQPKEPAGKCESHKQGTSTGTAQGKAAEKAVPASTA